MKTRLMDNTSTQIETVKQDKNQNVKILIIPVIISVTWILLKVDEMILATFEINLRCCARRDRYNCELCNSYNKSGNRDSRQTGHILCQDKSVPTRPILESIPTGNRYRGRPRLRQKDAVSEETGKIDAGNWMISGKDSGQNQRKSRLPCKAVGPIM